MKLKEGFEALNAYGEILKASTSVSGVVLRFQLLQAHVSNIRSYGKYGRCCYCG